MIRAPVLPARSARIWTKLRDMMRGHKHVYYLKESWVRSAWKVLPIERTGWGKANYWRQWYLQWTRAENENNVQKPANKTGTNHCKRNSENMNWGLSIYDLPAMKIAEGALTRMISTKKEVAILGHTCIRSPAYLLTVDNGSDSLQDSRSYTHEMWAVAS